MNSQNVTPKVSVIVPCYNVERYLNRCMDSITKQSLQDIQIILVDDLSPDSVPQLCDEWAKKDSRIVVVHKKINEGLGMARNSGLDVAEGEYVAFVDSDDFIDISMYEKLYDNAKSYDSDVVLCNCFMYKTSADKKERYDVTKTQIFDGKNEVNDFLLDLVAPQPDYHKDVKYMMSVWHGIYKREVLEKNHIRFHSEREVVSEDLVYNIDLYPNVNKVLYIPDCLYYYCFNGESLSNKFSKIKYEKIKRMLSYAECKCQSIFGVTSKIRTDRLKFFYMRNMLKKCVLSKPSELSFDEVLNDEYWDDMTGDYPYNLMDVKHRAFFFLIKYKIAWLLRLTVTKI